MKVSCMHYTNSARLVAGVEAFCQEAGFRFFCLEGAITRNKNKFTVASEEVTVLITCISQKGQKALAAVLTNNSEYKKYSGKTVELDLFQQAKIHYDLCQLLMEKFGNTNNAFNIEFAGNGATVTLTPEVEEGQKGLCCTLKGTSGEAIITGPKAIEGVLDTCTDVKFFSYTSITPDCEKTVSVRKSRGEIFREISHYLNKTIVLASMIDGQIVEQYISATSVLEVYTKPDGVRFYKRISPIVMRASSPFCIYLTTASVEDIAREQGRSLRKN